MACILPEAGHPDQMENGSCSMLDVQYKDLLDTDYTDCIDEVIAEF